MICSYYFYRVRDHLSPEDSVQVDKVYLISNLSFK